MNLTFILILFPLLIGCVSHTQLAKQALRETVSSDYPVEFRNVISYPGKVTCGEFLAEDRWDGSSGFKPFIFRQELVDIRPISLDLQVFCVTDPAAAIYALFGIDTSKESAPREQHIREDFQTLLAALENYYRHHSRYPKTQGGLELLLVSDGVDKKTGLQVGVGALEELPLDPWRRPYLYEGPIFSGVKSTPRVSTLGEDGLIGGKDEEADIKDEYMKYLDHIKTM